MYNLFKTTKDLKKMGFIILKLEQLNLNLIQDLKTSLKLKNKTYT